MHGVPFLFLTVLIILIYYSKLVLILFRLGYSTFMVWCPFPVQLLVLEISDYSASFWRYMLIVDLFEICFTFRTLILNEMLQAAKHIYIFFWLFFWFLWFLQGDASTQGIGPLALFDYTDAFTTATVCVLEEVIFFS